MLKVEQKKAIRLSAVLLVSSAAIFGDDCRFTCRLWKESHFQLLVLLVKRTGNYTSLLVITPLVSIINDQIMQVEAMNLTAYNLAQKKDVEGGKFNVVYASTVFKPFHFLFARKDAA